MNVKRLLFVLVVLGALGCETEDSASTGRGDDSPAKAAASLSTGKASPARTAAATSSKVDASPSPSAKSSVAAKELYRLNCQACHGPGGNGTPQAPALTAKARALAGGEGESELRRRLSAGGQRMPSFSYLPTPEVDALIGYLRELGGGAPAPAAPVKSAALSKTALGERIYQSNCASCHDPKHAAAAGLMCQPASLVGATERFSKPEVMNLLDVGVGPMPAFGHLTAEERDSLWEYLGNLSPEPGAKPTPGTTCPMVRRAMAGKRMGGMMHGRGMMDRGMMGGSMMRHGAGCPMMGPAKGSDASSSKKTLPPCCQ